MFRGLQHCYLGGPACARLACKRWAEAFADSWPTLTPPGDFPPLVGWARRSFRGLEELDLSCCGTDTLSRFLHEAPLLPRLESVRLPTCCIDTDVGAVLGAGLRRLSSLSLRHCKELTDGGICRALLQGRSAPPPLARLDLFGCSGLTEAALEALAGLPLMELDVGRCDIGSLGVLAALPSLTRLGVSYCRALSDSDLQVLPAALPGLQSLDLYECIGLSDACVQQHLSALTSLEELHLAFGEALTDDGMLGLRPLARLRVLNLYATSVSAAGLRSLPALTSLHTINLGGTPAATDEGITCLAPAAPQATSLTLARGLITDRGLELLQRLPRLRTLGLRDNPGVSDEGLKYLLSLPLTSLDLSFCHDLTSTGLKETLCRLFRLEDLSLEGCYLICPEGLWALTCLSSMRTLSLVGCDLVTESVVDELQDAFEQRDAMTILL